MTGLTSIGKVTNDGLTATVSSVVTTAGLLYLVQGSGCGDANGGGNYYDSLTTTTTGPIVDRPSDAGQDAYVRCFTSDATPLGCLDVFVGDGSTVNVTVTMGSPQGTPLSPITSCCVIECSADITGTGRVAVDNIDVSGGGAWDDDLTLAGSPDGMNQVVGVIAGSFDAANTFSPRYSETEIDEGSDTHANGNGMGGAAGCNLTWQVQLAPSGTLTSGWHGTGDDIRQAVVLVELIVSVPEAIVDRLLQQDGFKILQQDGSVLFGQNASPAVENTVQSSFFFS